MADATLAIQNVSFRPDGIVEVTYTEPHDEGEQIALVKTLMFSVKEVPEQLLLDVIDSVTDLVDEMLVKLRNPPDRKPGRRG